MWDYDLPLAKQIKKKDPEAENENSMIALRIKQQMVKKLLDLNSYHVNRNVIDMYRELVIQNKKCNLYDVNMSHISRKYFKEVFLEIKRKF